MMDDELAQQQRLGSASADYELRTFNGDEPSELRSRSKLSNLDDSGLGFTPRDSEEQRPPPRTVPVLWASAVIREEPVSITMGAWPVSAGASPPLMTAPRSTSHEPHGCRGVLPLLEILAGKHIMCEKLNVLLDE